MYGYQEYIDLTPEQVLQKVSQQQIFELALQEEFSFNKLYRSPLREDTKAGCRFEERPDGTILFLDFGDSTIHRTCFKLLMDTTGKNLTQAIRYIHEKFNLSADPKDYSPVIYKKVESKENFKTDIKFDKKDYTSRDRTFWNRFNITTNHLQEDYVYSAARIYINNEAKKKKTVFVPRDLCFVIDFFDAVNIYQPYNSTHKHIKNTNENHIGNFDNLPPTGEYLVITKSYKDHRILRNLGWANTIWFMSESIIPDVSILKNLTKRFNKIKVFYDNDYAGLKFGYRLVTLLNSLEWGCADMVYIPLKYRYKDLGEIIPREGERDTIKLLNQLKL